MSGGSFLPILQIVLFVTAAWLAERGLKALNVSPVLGPIMAGMVLGPAVLDIVPYAHPEQEGGEALPSLFALAGTIGVTLMIAESGQHLDLKVIQDVGGQAFVVAILGTLLPLCSAIGVLALLGFDVFPEGLAAGAAMAPTSVGIALKLLAETKQQKSVFGQTIVTAAFVDDVLSLLALVVLMNLASGSVTFLSVGVPLLASIVFVGCGVFLAVRVAPRFVPWLLGRIKENEAASHQPRDEAHLGLMLAWLVVCSQLGSLIGSHLLGAFVGGMTFTKVSRSHTVWRRQMKRIAQWLVRLFFSATVAFSIPVSTMLSWEAFYKGLIVALVCGILSKLASGLFIGPDRWVVGSAMLPRGEFAFLVAEQSTRTVVVGLGRSLLSKGAYAIVVWALLLSTIVAPLMFGYLLARKMSRTRLRRSMSIGRRTAQNTFQIRLEGHHHTGLLHEVVDCLNGMMLDVLEASVESDGHVDAALFVVKPRSEGEVTEEKIAEIKHTVLDAVNDESCQVVFMPVPLEMHGVLEIKFMSRHHPDLLHELCDTLHDMALDVVRMCVTDHDDTDVDTFYCSDVGSTTCTASGAKLDRIRYKVAHMLGEHNCQGEIMLKMVSLEDVHRREVVANPAAMALKHHGMLKITARGDHHPDILHELTDTLSLLGLDVMYADVDTTITKRGHRKDVDVFYAKEAPGKPVPPRERRDEISRKLQTRYDAHGCVGVVKVQSWAIDGASPLPMPTPAEHRPQLVRLGGSYDDFEVGSPEKSAKQDPTEVTESFKGGIPVLSLGAAHSGSATSPPARRRQRSSSGGSSGDDDVGSISPHSRGVGSPRAGPVEAGGSGPIAGSLPLGEAHTIEEIIAHHSSPVAGARSPPRSGLPGPPPGGAVLRNAASGASPSGKPLVGASPPRKPLPPPPPEYIRTPRRRSLEAGSLNVTPAQMTALMSNGSARSASGVSLDSAPESGASVPLISTDSAVVAAGDCDDVSGATTKDAHHPVESGGGGGGGAATISVPIVNEDEEAASTPFRSADSVGSDRRASMEDIGVDVDGE